MLPRRISVPRTGNRAQWKLEGRYTGEIAEAKLITRREMLGMVGASVLLASMVHAEKVRSANLPLGGSGAGGFFPSGHWEYQFQPMMAKYPDPTAGSNAPHLYAYYDPSTQIGLLWDFPYVPSFGSPPYVFILMGGPAGMSLGASAWQPWPTWFSGLDAHNAGYGRARILPAAAFSNAQVWVRAFSQFDVTQPIQYVDFQHNLSTSTSQFVFVDNVDGSTGGSGTLQSPLTGSVTPFDVSHGTTAAATTAYAGKRCILRGRGTAYTMPQYSDGQSQFYISGTKKPISIEAYPGEAVTLDGLSSSLNLLTTDMALRGVAINSYQSSVANYRAIGHGASRQILDGVSYINGGYGSNGGNVACMAYSAGNGDANYKNIVHTGCSDINHASGNQSPYVNNYSGAVMYSVDGYVCQFCLASSPGAASSGAWYMKGAMTNSFIWGCKADFSGGGNCVLAFSVGQDGGGGSGTSYNDQSIFNVGLGVQQIQMPQVSGVGPFNASRNSLLTASNGNGLFCGIPNSTGPYIFNRNVVQTNVAPQPTSGTGVQATGNISGTAVLNSDGTLASSERANEGFAGVQIL